MKVYLRGGDYKDNSIITYNKVFDWKWERIRIANSADFSILYSKKQLKVINL